MNPLKLLVPLLIAYSMHAADPRDLEKAIDVLKSEGTKSPIVEGVRYQKDVKSDFMENATITVFYQKQVHGTSALQVVIAEVTEEKARSTSIIDFLGGRPDGVPDKYIIAEIDSRTMMDMYHNGDTNFDPFETERGKPKKHHIQMFDAAIDYLLKEPTTGGDPHK